MPLLHYKLFCRKTQCKVSIQPINPTRRFAVGIGCSCHCFRLAFVQICALRHRSSIPKG